MMINIMGLNNVSTHGENSIESEFEKKFPSSREIFLKR